MSKGHAKRRLSRTRRRTLVRWGTRALYFLVALMLVAWELQEQGDLISSDRCDLRSAPQSQSLIGDLLMDPAYKFLLAHSTPAVSNRVSVVAIESALQKIQSNVCPARAFTADLLRAIAAQQPAVIAIDKFYGSSSCLDDDPGNIALRKAIREINIPLVVGESTHAPPDVKSPVCLVLTPQFDLGKTIPHGLTRLNQDVLRLPMRWPVLPSDDAKPTAAQPEESFSLIAASQADATLSKQAANPAFYNDDHQPYVNLTGTLERQTATNLLCRVARDVAAKYDIKCGEVSQYDLYDLHNKVVVIGAESDADFPAVLGEGMYGFELQSRYVAAMLSGSYLRQLPLLFQLLPLALYFILSELMVPYMHIHRHPRWPLFHIERPLVWTVAIYLATVLLGIVIPLPFHRFPPLPMLLGISGILIPRLLIEGWAILNEDEEDPHGEELA